jgi:hypothetical protein
VGLRRPTLDRAELCALASGLLLFVPGARVVWTWPWLWVVPGWFFVRRVLGARGGFLVAALSIVTSIAVSSLVCLPLTVLVGGPRTWAVVGSIAVFALACSCARAADSSLPAVPRPPLPALGLAGAFVVYRVAVAIA